MGEGGGEGVGDVGAGDGGSGNAGDGQAGVVVKQVEDFGAGAIGELPVGDVGLPEFVGLVGAKAFPCRSGSFVWLRGHEATPGQDTPDGGYSRNFGDRWVTAEMFGDGGSTSVVALFGQGFTQSDDRVFDGRVDGVTVVVGST